MKFDTAAIVELITAIPYMFSFVYLIVNFTDNIRLKSKKMAYIIGIAILYIGAVYNLIVNAYSALADFTPYIVSCAAFVGTVFLINKDKWTRKLLILVWLILPTLIIEIFMEIWMYCFVTHDIDSLLADPVANVYTRMFSSTFTICINICVILFHNRRKIKRGFLSIIFLSLFPIVQAMYLTLILAPAKADSLKSVLIVNCMFLLIFSIMFFLYVYFITITNRVYQKEQEQLLIAEMKEKDQQYYEMVQEDIKRIRFVRHDMRNFVDQLNYLLDEGTDSSVNQAKSLLKEIDSSISNYSAEKYCEHQVANMILTLAHNKAVCNDVTFDISAAVPAAISISDMDLSSVLSNLTDNAIRGSEDYKAATNKDASAEISIAVKNDYLVIKTTNPTDNKKTIKNIDELKTTKKDTTSHGLGLQILKDIASKYEGNLTVEIEEGICTFGMILKV